jgi:hypothetical protein
MGRRRLLQPRLETTQLLSGSSALLIFENLCLKDFSFCLKSFSSQTPYLRSFRFLRSSFYEIKTVDLLKFSNLLGVNMENKTFNINGVRNLYRSNSAARIMLESLAVRRNNRSITTVSSLYSVLRLAAFDISRKEIIQVFQTLQKLECGELVFGVKKGSRNMQSRFVWKINLGEVGRVAIEKRLQPWN